MDSLTQGLLGAAAAQAVARPGNIRKATIAGVLGGMAADLDVLISSPTDFLLFIQYHRHFTHSLFFIPFGGLICALALWPFFRKSSSFSQVYLWTTIAYATHGLLDACTSYGTSLYWPFSETRVSWSIMPIIDPIFTPILLLAVLGTYRNLRKSTVYLGLAFVAAYFSLGKIQHDAAATAQIHLATTRGHFDRKQEIVKPTIGNQILWRSVYEHEGKFFVDAIRVSPFSGVGYYPGTSIKKLNPKKDLTWVTANSTTDNDIVRFTHFSQGFLAQQEDNPDLLVDVRYATLPNSTSPLWTITLDPNDSNKHTPFITYRQGLREVRAVFFAQLRGEKSLKLKQLQTND